ncbi:MAG: suppressor of fused domain protein, partial [Gemmataceae bacterium]
LFPGSVLDHILFLPSIIDPDNTLPEQLVLDGDPVGLLWVVPITGLECKFIQQKDVNAFLDLLEKKEHPFVLDESRKSYVRK